MVLLQPIAFIGAEIQNQESSTRRDSLNSGGKRRLLENFPDSHLSFSSILRKLGVGAKGVVGEV